MWLIESIGGKMKQNKKDYLFKINVYATIILMSFYLSLLTRWGYLWGFIGGFYFLLFVDSWMRWLDER